MENTRSAESEQEGNEGASNEQGDELGIRAVVRRARHGGQITTDHEIAATVDAQHVSIAVVESGVEQPFTHPQLGDDLSGWDVVGHRLFSRGQSQGDIG